MISVLSDKDLRKMSSGSFTVLYVICVLPINFIGIDKWSFPDFNPSLL